MLDDGSDEKFTNTGICEHLKPVEDYLRSRGLRIVYVGQPWSRNCRTWVYFGDVVLDAQSLKARLGLADCVVVHSHRGTVDGAEQGLVCETDHDAVMGAHPDVADGTIPRVG
jgi:hypothetical protein